MKHVDEQPSSLINPSRRYLVLGGLAALATAISDRAQASKFKSDPRYPAPAVRSPGQSAPTI